MTIDAGDERGRLPGSGRPACRSMRGWWTGRDGGGVEPVPGLSVRVLDTGWMELGRPDSTTCLLCDETGTAMWIALCQASWNLGDAAARLARLWDVSPWAVRDVMRDWIRDLSDAGLVEP